MSIKQQFGDSVCQGLHCTGCMYSHFHHFWEERKCNLKAERGDHMKVVVSDAMITPVSNRHIERNSVSAVTKALQLILCI